MEAIAGLLCLVLATGLGAALQHHRGATFADEPGEWFIRGQLRLGVPSALTDLLAHVGDPVFVIPAVLIVAVGAAVEHRRMSESVAVLAASAAVALAVRLGKDLVDRTLESTSPTFPSGHVGATVVLTVAAALVFRHRRAAGWPARVLLAVVPITAAVGAVATRSHVVTDVVGGALVGFGCALLAWAALVPLPWEEGRRGR